MAHRAQRPGLQSFTRGELTCDTRTLPGRTGLAQMDTTGLAERSGVSRSSVISFENHSRPLDQQKATQIGLTFRSAGISFTDRGIEFAPPG